MSKLVKFRLHGDITKFIAASWDLKVNSVIEGFHAINTLTNNAFNNYFITNNKIYAKYRILINGRDFISPVSELGEENAQLAYQSELVMKKNDLETVDFVPVLESAIIAAIAVVAGVVGSEFIATIIVYVVLAALMAGISYLLSRPPDFGKFRSIDKAGGESYLFGGPMNIIGEGGPVPVGYGRAIVGSQVISSAYKIKDYQVWRNDLAKK